jgi:hypothetical protein
MRSVSVRRGAAVLAFLAILSVTPVALADEGNPTDPPQAKIGPPIGVAGQAEEPPSLFDLFLVWLQAKIGPPIG